MYTFVKDFLHLCLNMNYNLFFIVPQTTLDLTISSLSPISLNVEWSVINVNLINGAVTQYQVMWKLLHSSSNYIQVLHENTRQYTITGKLWL